jgi:hypothetical protein
MGRHSAENREMGTGQAMSTLKFVQCACYHAERFDGNMSGARNKKRAAAVFSAMYHHEKWWLYTSKTARRRRTSLLAMMLYEYCGLDL